MDESMANNLLITLSTSELDVYYIFYVAFDDWIQAIKIRKWQITNAIIHYVDLCIRPSLIDHFHLFSFELRAEWGRTISIDTINVRHIKWINFGNLFILLEQRNELTWNRSTTMTIINFGFNKFFLFLWLKILSNWI